jgi:hypothetical protein
MAGSPFPKKYVQSQVDSVNAIVDAFEAAKLTRLTHLAYCIATPIIECGWPLKPITERGPKAYFMKYDINGPRPKKARELGNIYPGDGFKFRGMGFVQSTGRGNAIKNTALIHEILGVDVNFEETPERMLEPKFAAVSLVVGLERGIYTGHKLGDYLDGPNPDWKNARRTVNALDRAGEIAGYAKQIYSDLLSATGAHPPL